MPNKTPHGFHLRSKTCIINFFVSFEKTSKKTQATRASSGVPNTEKTDESTRPYLAFYNVDETRNHFQV